MTHDGTSPSAGERRSIFGLETEYLVLYVPDLYEAGAARSDSPPFSVIEDLIYSTLRDLRRTARSSGSKRGYFLENGGLVHLEVFLGHQGDTPILEVSTPECRTPQDLVLYSRAFDRLLHDLSRRSTEVLVERGFHGYLAFVKGNRDRRGVGFGCHENYLVANSLSPIDRALVVAATPLLLFLLLPAIVAYLVVVLVLIACLALARLAPSLEVFWRRFLDGLRRRPALWQSVIATCHLTSNALLYPGIRFFTAIVRRRAFRPYLRHLSSFLVSRQVLDGSGGLDFREKAFVLSQRADLVATVANIIVFGKKKTMFDLKGLLEVFLRPQVLWARDQKLVVTSGDSNLCDVSLFLKVATTALIIEMIEAGVVFEDLRLADPVWSLRAVAVHGPWKELPAIHGGPLHAIAIQREYLARAKAHFADRAPGRMRYDRVLELWESTLAAAEERPRSLVDRCDWAAKKDLLDTQVRDGANWRTFLEWGHVLERGDVLRLAAASDFEAWLRTLPVWRRGECRAGLRRAGLDASEFVRYRELYLRARKIDFRYHEIGPLGGYQRLLEAEGHIRRLTDDFDVERATREAPSDTRARVRGHYIRTSPDRDSVFASWSEIETLVPARHIALPDPFFHGLPGDR